MAKYLDISGLSHFWGKIKVWVQNYVKVTPNNNDYTITVGNTSVTPVLKDGNKVLSDNNFTNALKTKLEGVASGAQVNVLEGVQKNGVDISIVGKKANITVPTSTSDLANDSGFITIADVPAGAAPSTTTPNMDGTANVGTETAFARGDHRHPSDTTKADKVSNATEGHFAALDSNGNITDSGKAASNFATSAQGAKADTAYQKPSGGIPKNDLADVVKASLGLADTALQQGDLPAASTTTPSMDGTANAGSENAWAKGDHVHPTDTSRAPIASPTFTGTPKAPTAAASTNNTQIATTAFVKTVVGAITANDVSAVPSSEKGAANGVATLNSSGKVPSSQLPSYVDDVIEVYARAGQTALSENWFATGSASGTVVVPESGVIYILMETSGEYTANSQFRWGGTTYVKLNDGGVSAISNSEIDAVVEN